MCSECTCVYGWVCVYVCIFSPSELVHFSNTLNKIQKKLKFEHINSKTSEESPTYSTHLHIQFLFLAISKFSNVPVYLNLIQQRPQHSSILLVLFIELLYVILCGKKKKNLCWKRQRWRQSMHAELLITLAVMKFPS